MNTEKIKERISGSNIFIEQKTKNRKNKNN